MSQTRRTDQIIAGSSPNTQPDWETDDDAAQAVIEAYRAATAGPEAMRRRAFEAALQAYRICHPDVAPATARRRVARILCFAGADPSPNRVG